MSSSPLASELSARAVHPVVQLGQRGGERGDLGGGSHAHDDGHRRAAAPRTPRRQTGTTGTGGDPPVALWPHVPPYPGPARHPAALRGGPAAPVGTGVGRPRRGGRDPAARCGPRGTTPSSATPPSSTGWTCRTACGSPRRRSRRRAPTPTPRSGEALEVAFGRILAYHAHEGSRPGDLVEGGITVGHLTRAVERAGIYAPGGRARYPSTVLMCAAPARVAGVGSIALCVPPAADGQDRHGHAVRRLRRRRGRGLPDRRGPGHRRHGLRDGAACPPSTSSPARATPTWPRPSASCPGVVGVASAFAGPSEIVVVAGPDAPPAFAAIDLVVQAEHGPDGLAWLVTWDGGLAEEIAAEVDRMVAASSRRADLEATLATAGIVCLVDGPEQALAVANAIAPEHLQLMVPEDEGLALLGARPERRRRLRRAVVAGQHGGLHRRAEPRAADQPDGALRRRRCAPTTSASTCTRCGSRPTPCARSARSSSHWPRPRACPPTPTRCASASSALDDESRAS